MNQRQLRAKPANSKTLLTSYQSRRKADWGEVQYNRQGLGFGEDSFKLFNYRRD